MLSAVIGGVSTQTSRGFAYLASLSVFGRFVLFLSQWILALFLSPAELGVLALATTITSVAWTMVGFGVDDALQQRGKAIPFWERTVFILSAVQGTLGMTVLIALAPALAWAMHAPDLPLPIILLAIGMPVAALSMVPGVKIHAALDFKWIAGFGLFDLLATQALTLTFLFAGLGIYSAILPSLITLAARAVLYWNRAKPHLSGKISARSIRVIMARSAPVFGTRLLAAAMNAGDYFVLGLLGSTSAVGYYYFAFRLAAMPVRVLATNIETVLFPGLTQLRHNAAHQTGMALRAACALSHLVTPLCLMQAAIASPLLRLVFGDKWMPSILLIQILSLGLPVEAISAVAHAQLRANGEFARSLRFAVANSAVFFFFVTTGACWDGALGVSIAVAAYYLVTQPILFFLVFKSAQQRTNHVIRIFVAPYVIALASIGSVSAAASIAWPTDSMLMRLATIAFFAPLVHVCLIHMFARSACQDIWHAARRLVTRTEP
jgi:teichuronic acid exporter